MLNKIRNIETTGGFWVQKTPSPYFDGSNISDVSESRALGNNGEPWKPPAAAAIGYLLLQGSFSIPTGKALALGLPYEYKPVNLPAGEQFSPEFKCLNPLHYVPVLVDGDTVVSDSFAILLYLGDKYPQRLLLPADPRLKALNLQAASIISSSMQPLHMPSVLKYLTEKFGPEESLSWAQSNIEKGFFALEALLKDFDSRYATGDDVYMADVFLAPQIVVSTTRFNINMSKFPTLSRLHESYKILPEFEASLPERQPDAVH